MGISPMAKNHSQSRIARICSQRLPGVRWNLTRKPKACQGLWNLGPKPPGLGLAGLVWAVFFSFFFFLLLSSSFFFFSWEWEGVQGGSSLMPSLRTSRSLPPKRKGRRGQPAHRILGVFGWAKPHKTQNRYQKKKQRRIKPKNILSGSKLNANRYQKQQPKKGPVGHM